MVTHCMSPYMRFKKCAKKPPTWEKTAISTDSGAEFSGSNSDARKLIWIRSRDCIIKNNGRINNTCVGNEK